MIKSLKLTNRQVLILLVFSVLSAVAMIIHGIFFDLAFDEIKRLTFAGLLFTVVIIFPAILFLEWVFDLNNKKKFDSLEARIIKLEKKRN